MVTELGIGIRNRMAQNWPEWGVMGSGFVVIAALGIPATADRYTATQARADQAQVLNLIRAQDDRVRSLESRIENVAPRQLVVQLTSIQHGVESLAEQMGRVLVAIERHENRLDGLEQFRARAEATDG